MHVSQPCLPPPRYPLTRPASPFVRAHPARTPRTHTPRFHAAPTRSQRPRGPAQLPLKPTKVFTRIAHHKFRCLYIVDIHTLLFRRLGRPPPCAYSTMVRGQQPGSTKPFGVQNFATAVCTGRHHPPTAHHTAGVCPCCRRHEKRLLTAGVPPPCAGWYWAFCRSFGAIDFCYVCPR